MALIICMLTLSPLLHAGVLRACRLSLNMMKVCIHMPPSACDMWAVQ